MVQMSQSLSSTSVDLKKRIMPELSHEKTIKKVLKGMDLLLISLTLETRYTSNKEINIVIVSCKILVYLPFSTTQWQWKIL